MTAGVGGCNIVTNEGIKVRREYVREKEGSAGILLHHLG